MDEEEEYYAVGELIHTDEHPFCDDMSCPCHEDSENIGVVGEQVSDGLMTPAEADRYYRGQTI